MYISNTKCKIIKLLYMYFTHTVTVREKKNWAFFFLSWVFFPPRKSVRKFFYDLFTIILKLRESRKNATRDRFVTCIFVTLLGNNFIWWREIFCTFSLHHCGEYKPISQCLKCHHMKIRRKHLVYFLCILWTKSV